MKLSMMELAEQAGARPMAACPYCLQPPLTRRRLWWRRAMIGVGIAWAAGLIGLGAAIWIEARIVTEQWAMVERATTLIELADRTRHAR